MPIRMTDDNPNDSRDDEDQGGKGSGGGSSGDGSGGGLGALLALLGIVALLFRQPKLAVALLVIGPRTSSARATRSPR
jgi:hypothetical protein